MTEEQKRLLAMGIEERIAHGSVRFSFARDTSLEDLESAAEVIADVVASLGHDLPQPG